MRPEDRTRILHMIEAAEANRGVPLWAYFDVNRNILWKTATEEIPALVPTLRELMKA